MVACRMEKTFEEHQPVLLEEVINHLTIKMDGIYIDATFGRGGHSQSILKHLGPSGHLFAFDQDPEAVAYAEKTFADDRRFKIFHAAFSKLQALLTAEGFAGKIDGILFDLGVSSPQLDNPNRGFSFMRTGNLDMRMDTSQGEDAKEWLSKIPEKELADVLWSLGEERFSRRIAHAIVEAREEAPITTTKQLADIIAKAVPTREKGKNPATRSFQAIRIAVNRELDELDQGLQQAFEVLKVGGRLLVISFHSLEDRLVKHFIQRKERSGEIPARMPIKQKDLDPPLLKRVGRAIKPSEKEIAKNPRARSAVLRIAEKQP